MDIAFLFGLGALGLVVGSYIGALTWRIPWGISIAKGRSFCDFCRKKIIWSDNIPIVSYLILGGRCRRCKKRISIRYPLIEAVSLLGFVLIGIFVRPYEIPFYLLISCGLLVVFITDLEHQIIPDSIVFSLFFITIAYYLLLPSAFFDFYVRVASGLGAAVFLLFVHLITRGRGMGLGDAKFALFAGTFLGFPNTLVWLFVSFLTGAGVGIILILVRRAKFGKAIAFGPFLALGVIITLIFGNIILKKWL